MTLVETQGSRAGSNDPESLTYLDAISAAMRDALRLDERVLLLGQDVAEYGGAFKATRGFLDEFGAQRIINTPICESGTIGAAVGLALLGFRPTVEMQFADFITCGFNQVVNVAAKMRWRTGYSAPIVIRCPYGGGVGAGAFHSQSNEAWFTHAPGLQIVAPSTPEDAYGLLRASLEAEEPVVYFEHKRLYRRVKGPVPRKLTPIGQARVLREGRHVTVVSYGWMVHLCLEAAELAAREGVSAELLDLRTLIPLDERALLASVRKTGKALIVHEAPLTGGFGAELAARLGERAFEHLDGPVRRLAYPDIPVAFHPALEAAALPDSGRIARAIVDLARW